MEKTKIIPKIEIPKLKGSYIKNGLLAILFYAGGSYLGKQINSHTVIYGENLNNISDMYDNNNITTALLNLNKVFSRDLIFPGDEISVRAKQDIIEEKKETREYRKKINDEFNQGQRRMDILSKESNKGLEDFKNIPSNLLDTLESYKIGTIDTTYEQILITQGYDLSKDSIKFETRIKQSENGYNKINHSIPIDLVKKVASSQITNINYVGEDGISVSEQDAVNQYHKLFISDYQNSKDLLKVYNNIIFEKGKLYTYGEKIKKIINFIGSKQVSDGKERYGENIIIKGLNFKSDYNIPGALVPLVGGDCNSNTGLFVQLCRLNNIISGIGTTTGHAYAYIGMKTEDVTYISNSIPDRSPLSELKTIIHGEYTFIAVEPSSGGEWTKGELNASGNNDGFAIFYPK